MRCIGCFLNPPIRSLTDTTLGQSSAIYLVWEWLRFKGWRSVLVGGCVVLAGMTLEISGRLSNYGHDDWTSHMG